MTLKLIPEFLHLYAAAVKSSSVEDNIGVFGGSRVIDFQRHILENPSSTQKYERITAAE